MGHVWAVVGEISRHSCLGYTLSVGFGINSVATERTVNTCRSAIFGFTQQFRVQGEVGLSPAVAVT